MLNMLDVFKGDAFSTFELTAAIQKLPYVPNRLAGLFTHKGVRNTTVAIERKKGKIALVPVKTRGSGETTKKHSTKRDMIPFVIPHIPYDDQVLADDVQNVRQFGREANSLETVANVVNDKLAILRQDHEVTHEYHRVGAIQGLVLDADATTQIFDLFDIFDIVEEEVEFDFTDPTEELKLRAMAVRRIIETNLGGVPFTGITAQVGDGFWDALVTHEATKKAFDRWQESRFLREDQRAQSIAQFECWGILWQNYRGKVGDVDFIPSDVARFYPSGVAELFVHYSAPADFIEAVNTVGQPIYAKQERMKFDKGIELHTQSNPCILCTRPEVLVKGTGVVEESSP